MMQYIVRLNTTVLVEAEYRSQAIERAKEHVSKHIDLLKAAEVLKAVELLEAS